MAELYASIWEGSDESSPATDRLSAEQHALACEIAAELALAPPAPDASVRWDYGTASWMLILSTAPWCTIHYHAESTSVRGDVPALDRSPFFGVKRGYRAARGDE